MTDLFKTYGLPKVIHSDNGTPFAAPNGILNLTTLAVWWITLGILPDRSLKGHPEQNGSLERMHKDIADEIEESARRDFGESGCARRMGKGIQLCQTE